MRDSTDPKSNPFMNDIRPGLRDRITLLEAMATEEQAKFTAEQEKAVSAHKHRMESIRKTIINYKNLLELEDGFVQHVDQINAKVGPSQAETAAADAKMPIPQPLPPLGDFFCAELARRGELSKELLRQLAFDAGYFPTSEGGRATHATLVNLIRAGRVMQLKDNMFSAPEREKELL